MSGGVQIATKGIISVNSSSHSISIATKGYVFIPRMSIRYEELRLNSYIYPTLELESLI